jgi:hypothetical protein
MSRKKYNYTPNVFEEFLPTMRSHLFFKIVSPIFQIGSFVSLRYHDYFKCVSRFFQITLTFLQQKVIHLV